MILKSFYKKRTTKIYLIILILSIVILGNLIVGQNYYIRKTNEIYDQSFIYISSNKKIDFKNIDNIKSYKKSIRINDMFFLISSENETSKDGIKLPSYLKNKYKIGDVLGYNELIDFKVTDYYNQPYPSPICYINEETLNKITENQKEYTYLVYLKDWFKRNTTIQYFEEEENAEVFSLKINKINVDFTLMINNFKIYTKIMTVVFIIILIFVIKSIINEENKKISLYHYLGYSKLTIIKVEIINILSLLLSSVFLSTIIINLMKIIIYK